MHNFKFSFSYKLLTMCQYILQLVYKYSILRSIVYRHILCKKHRFFGNHWPRASGRQTQGCCKRKRMVIRSLIRVASVCIRAVNTRAREEAKEPHAPHLRFSRRVVRYRYLRMRFLPHDTSIGVLRRNWQCLTN